MTATRRILILLFVLAIIAFSNGETFAASCKDTPLGEGPEFAPTFAAACTETAINEPYQLAWLLFSKICPLDSDRPQPCEWQGWATNDQTFPERPLKGEGPNWPANAAAQEFPCMEGAVAEGYLERRRNKPEFDYIISHDLWYQEGLVKAWNDNFVIDVPQNALNVAVSWKEIKEQDKDRYHWKVLADGTICGLTTLDVKSKILPRWFFFAFEHVDNPGRCDFTGCRDDFGQTPQFIPPIFTSETPKFYDPEKLDELPAADRRPTYEPAALTAEVTELLGVNGVWKNYRLKGIQSDFVTADGRPTILAGSQIEGLFFPASSSCITCHSQAGFNEKGQNLREKGQIGEFQLSPNGVPDPGWFYDMGPGGWQLRYQQADYVWAIPINACPITCPASDADRKLVPDRCYCRH